MAVREGAPAPDISTPDAFRKTLLDARAIAFTDASVGGTAAVFLPGLFERMGIADEIDRKALPQKSGAEVAECVASGQAELGITLIPEILPIKGASVIGKLPPRSPTTPPIRPPCRRARATRRPPPRSSRRWRGRRRARCGRRPDSSGRDARDDMPRSFRLAPASLRGLNPIPE